MTPFLGQLSYLFLAVEHLVEGLQSLHIELDEFPQQVKAALQDFLGTNVMLNNVVGNMLKNIVSPFLTLSISIYSTQNRLRATYM